MSTSLKNYQQSAESVGSVEELRQRIALLDERIAALQRERETARIAWYFGSFSDFNRTPSD